MKIAVLQLSAALIAVCIVQPPSNAVAQSKTVAVVNGQAITETDLALAEVVWGNQLADIAPESRRRTIVGLLVESYLITKAAIDEKLMPKNQQTELEKFGARIAVRDYYIQKKVNEQVTDDELKKFYDQQISLMKPIEEVHARYILVDSREKASDILKQLSAGTSFDALARRYSIDPTTNLIGGDLGYFEKNQMISPVDDAAFSLKPGQVSEPLQSQFGWHVVFVEDRRQRPLPKFDELKETLRVALAQRKSQELVAKLRDRATVDIKDEQVAKAIVEQSTKTASNTVAPLVSRWTQAGSLMDLKADGASRRFIYQTPTDSLKLQGVSTGTLLFEGKKDGNRYVGKAYTFVSSCKPEEYQVTGDISADEKQVTLHGKAPEVGTNCKITGTRDAVLVFTYAPNDDQK